MALAYLTINLDAFTGADAPPLSRYATITLDPGVDHVDMVADVIHVRSITVTLDAAGRAATANGVACIDGRVPVVAGVTYAVSGPGVLREAFTVPALTAGQVVHLADVYVPGTPLTPDQASTLAAQITTLVDSEQAARTAADAQHASAPDPHPQYLTTGRGDARYVQGTDSRLSDARTPTAHTHPVAQVSDSTATGRALVTATDAAAARGTLGLDTAATVGALPIPDPGAYYPTDTITAALQLIGGRERYGTGSPEGVVTAPVGTYYTDTAITNGAMRWAKKSGTGSTGWQVIEGDTGWRRITSFLNGWTGVLDVRRVNDVLHYRTAYSGATALVGTAATSKVFLAPNTLGSGMFFVGEHRTHNYRPTGAVMGNSYYYHTGWELPAFGTAADVYTFPAGSFFFLDSAWPTTLPGVAV